jgi:hypothetical protein
MKIQLGYYNLACECVDVSVRVEYCASARDCPAGYFNSHRTHLSESLGRVLGESRGRSLAGAPRGISSPASRKRRQKGNSVSNGTVKFGLKFCLDLDLTVSTARSRSVLSSERAPYITIQVNVRVKEI